MKIDIILGCLFGDEGKGQTVNALATKDSLVIRFSGGHQSGHNVVSETNQHIFSQLCAGTFKGAAAYISEFCTVYPKGFIKELDALYRNNASFMNEKVLQKYFVNPLAMVTTPYDIAYNKVREGIVKHGTTGAGYSATIERNENNITLYASELKIPFIYNHKIKQIMKYYEDIVRSFDIDSRLFYSDLVQEEEEDWQTALDYYLNKVNITGLNIDDYSHIVFEGSQGIMLDKQLGLFPHVTRSNTTAMNAMKMLQKMNARSNINSLTINYVTRAYMTRHGSGPFVEKTIKLKNTKNETNILNDWQGEFRVAPMNFDLLRHAINVNNSIVSRYGFNYKTKLYVTCCVQMPKEFNSEDFEKKFIVSARRQVDNIYYKYSRDWIL